MVIAIDGPAASGKSTTAHMVSQTLGMVYMDSGLMYRGVAYALLKHQIECVDHRVEAFLPQMQLEVLSVDSIMNVYVDSSDVAKIPNVRQWLFKIQRTFSKQYGDDPGIVTVGRDMGTVVFPDATLKFFLTASIDVRAQRRVQEFRQKGITMNYQEVHEAIVHRDHQDIHRTIAPLKQAPDAILINTDDLTPEGQANIILSKVREQSQS